MCGVTTETTSISMYNTKRLCMRPLPTSTSFHVCQSTVTCLKSVGEDGGRYWARTRGNDHTITGDLGFKPLGLGLLHSSLSLVTSRLTVNVDKRHGNSGLDNNKEIQDDINFRFLTNCVKASKPRKNYPSVIQGLHTFIPMTCRAHVAQQEDQY